MGSGEHGHHDVSRDELMKPYEPSIGEKYILPFFSTLIDAPVTFFREQIVEKIRQPYPYYHRKYNRVPTIENCKLDDPVCFQEANAQFHRDRMVEVNILRILRQRREECAKWHRHEQEDVDRFCKDIMVEHEEAAVNYFIKYGELSWNTSVIDAFMKQKHRMLWERKHGEVGAGEVGSAARAVKAADKAIKQEDNMFTKMRRGINQLGYPKEIRP